MGVAVLLHKHKKTGGTYFAMTKNVMTHNMEISNTPLMKKFRYLFPAKLDTFSASP